MKDLPHDDALDRFSACWDILDDPRTGNAVLRGFLWLEDGLPSCVFSRVIRQLNPEKFRAASQRFMTRFSETRESVVAI